MQHPSILFSCRDDRLTWHGVIPPDEVWIKLGGDKGRGSVKMNMQVVNVKNPNSIKNTSLFAVFEGDDSVVNLHTVLDPYKQQVKEMQGMDWGLVTCIIMFTG